MVRKSRTQIVLPSIGIAIICPVAPITSPVILDASARGD